MGNTILDTVRAVQNVKDCHLIEDKGEISQLFVEASLSATKEEERTQEIKGIVRSIIGAVAINHDLELDYRKIKVIEYKLAEQTDLKTAHPRIQIAAAYQRRIPHAEMIVELSSLGASYVGTARCTDDPAVDTFNACGQALFEMGFGSLKLVYLQILNNDFGHEKIILLKLEYTHPDGKLDRLIGVAEINEDLPLAVVKAVLSAVNRRIFIAYPNRT